MQKQTFQSIKWLLHHAITVFSCVVIIIVGTAAIAYSSTTIGENISTNNLTAAGDLTVDTNTLFVDSTNNRLGIGTTSPWGLVSVSSGGVAEPGFVIGSSAATQFLVNNDGKVGIGTENPSQSLEVNGAVKALNFRVASGGGALLNDASPNYSRIRPLSTGTVIDRNISDANAALIVQQVNPGSTGDILQLKNDSGTKMVVNQQGKVGIGTTNPSLAQLQVVGNIYTSNGISFYESGENSAKNSFYRGSTDFQILRNYSRVYTILELLSPPGVLGSASSSEATIALVRGENPDREFIDIYNNGYASETQFGIRIQKRGTGSYRDFVFDQYDGTTKTPILVLKSSRNVGIGTFSPTTALDVAGVIKTRPTSTATCDTDVAGGIYFDSDDNHFYGCNGTAWVQLDN
ncbi:hypothetical protein LLG96_04255 [bacterium]|nr:hypothetical protein [bacterium]